jgi:hypothetical protein
MTTNSTTSTPQSDFIAGLGILRADATNNPALRQNMRYSLPSQAIGPTYGDLQHWNKLKVPLSTSEPATIFQWYTQLQAKAAPVDIHLCPLLLFNKEFSIIPGDITAPAIYDANNKLIQKFRSVDGSIRFWGTFGRIRPVIGHTMKNARERASSAGKLLGG